MLKQALAFAAALPLGLVAMSAAIAQAPAAPAQEQGYDPNEIVCEEITTLGSRIAKKRFCGTRAEWAEKRLRDRQEVEKAQSSPCVIQTTGARGHASC